MATMYDAVSVAAIPADATIVAGYVDGNWPTFDAVVARFPSAQHVSITVTGRPNVMVADLENGDLTASGAAGWVKAELAAGRRPGLYVERSNINNVVAALQADGIHAGAQSIDWWIADWTGEAHLVPNSVATQWANPPASGGNYDVSETNGVWPAQVAPTPPVPPTPPTPTPGGFVPPTLTQGDLSPAVKSLQRLLGAHASVAVDGDFGPATETAVKNFQTIFHLTVDGIVGPVTWTALDTFG